MEAPKKNMCFVRDGNKKEARHPKLIVTPATLPQKAQEEVVDKEEEEEEEYSEDEALQNLRCFVLFLRLIYL